MTVGQERGRARGRGRAKEGGREAGVALPGRGSHFRRSRELSGGSRCSKQIQRRQHRAPHPQPQLSVQMRKLLVQVRRAALGQILK
jgi:hypothetical protein